MWRCEMNENSEETGKWIILNFFPYSPVEVYGLFDTEEEARAYAEQQGMAKGDNSYSVHGVLNAHYHEDPSDYVGMGWVGADGRP
jgi:hypothetical protein